MPPFRTLASAIAPAITIALIAAPALAAALSPNAGAFQGSGALNDHDGNSGTWTAQGALAGGRFSGTLSIVLGGKPLAVALEPGPAYLENGFCVLRGTQGRNRAELRGKCDSASFGPGTVKGYFDGDREFNGEFTGALHWGKPVSAPSAGALPTAKLACGYMERVGGVVAGDTGTREWRPSALGTLTLSPGGAYTARNGAGRYTREGDAVRFTSGPWAGALGRVEPDNMGEPALYFELDDNRRPDGTYRVDPWRTACARQR